MEIERVTRTYEENQQRWLTIGIVFGVLITGGGLLIVVALHSLVEGDLPVWIAITSLGAVSLVAGAIGSLLASNSRVKVSPPVARETSAGFLEPGYLFLYRKSFAYVMAVLILIVLAVMDIGLILDGTGSHPEAPYWLNATVLLVLIALVFTGRRTAGLTRYSAHDSVVTLPFARTPNGPVAPHLSTGSVLAVSLEPSKSRPEVPASVRLTIDLPRPNAQESKVTFLIGSRDFGIGNLRDFVLRIPAACIDSDFGREWRKWVEYRENRAPP